MLRFLHLCLAPLLVLCLGDRPLTKQTSWCLEPGSSVSRRAAEVLARLVALHQKTWPQLGLEARFFFGSFLPSCSSYSWSGHSWQLKLSGAAAAARGLEKKTQVEGTAGPLAVFDALWPESRQGGRKKGSVRKVKVGVVPRWFNIKQAENG